MYRDLAIWVRDRLPNVFQEVLIVVLAVSLLGAMRPLLLSALMLRGEAVLFDFEASGRIDRFERINDSFRLVVASQCMVNDHTTLSLQGVTSLALRWAPSALRPGVHFEKRAGTRECTIEGRVYRLY